MFKSRKSRPETQVPERTYSSSEVADVAGVSLRQLQWWDERKVVSPRHEGHRRVYGRGEVIEITVIAELRRNSSRRLARRFHVDGIPPRAQAAGDPRARADHARGEVGVLV